MAGGHEGGGHETQAAHNTHSAAGDGIGNPIIGILKEAASPVIDMTVHAVEEARVVAAPDEIAQPGGKTH